MRAIILAAALALAASTAVARDAGGSRSSAAAGAVAGAASLSASQSSGGAATVTNATERQAPSVSAPSLSTSGESCMGSTAIGGSAAGFGVAIGSTWSAEQCERRMNSQQLRLMGETKAALALLCQNPGVADAMRAVGKSCPALPEKVDAAMAPAPVADAGFCLRWPADPFCRDER